MGDNHGNDQAFIVGLTQGNTKQSVPPWAYYTTLVIAVGPIIASAPAIGVRRLHDINKSGWWLRLFYLFPTAFIGIGILNFYCHAAGHSSRADDVPVFAADRLDFY